MQRIGIDLGTTHTAAALNDQVICLGEEGRNIFSSVVAFAPGDKVLVGQTARRRRSIDGANTIFSSKRILGRLFDHSLTRAYIKRYPFEVVDADGWPAFQTRAGLQTPTDIAAILLEQVHKRVHPILESSDVTITVPYGFNDSQREATRTAAASAGFNEVRLLDEPSATAWAYLNDPDVHGTVAVYDLGGGTFDVSILDLSGSAPRFLAGASDPFLGGDDIDIKIADWVHQEVLKSHNWDLKNYAEVELRLLAECERAKVRLAVETETYIELSEVDPECPAAEEGLVLRREVLNRLASDLVRKTFITCDGVLRTAGMVSGDLRAVLLAGGTTHLSVVREGVEMYFGRAGCATVDPIEVVAQGASCAIP